MRQIPDESIDLVLTDPPYNILNLDNIESSKFKITRNVDFDKEYFDIPPFIMEMSRVLKDGSSFYIFSSDKQMGIYINELKNYNLRYSNFLVWYHSVAPSVRKRSFQSHCQLIIFGHKEIEKKYTFNFSKSNEMGNLLNYEGCVSFEYSGGCPGEYVGHPTQKPTKLIQKLIKISSNDGDVVLDPFLGSGTTAVACEKLRRKWIGIEINKDYCEIARKRLEPWMNQSRLDGVFG